MPQKRQALTGPESAIRVRSIGLRLPPNHRVEPHHHEWHQLVYATEGVMTVETEGGCWVVPPQRAVWIPAGFEHSIRMTGTVRMRTLYFSPELPVSSSDSCFVLGVSDLLRELILEAIRVEMISRDDPGHMRLATVLLDQVHDTQESPLQVQLPTDPRARRVALQAQSDLATTRSIAQLTKGSGASVRTIERLFLQQTGLTFGRWLQRVRALHALEHLAAGESVTSAGLSVGYDSTSAFIAMFKRVLGTTPGAYFARLPTRSANLADRRKVQCAHTRTALLDGTKVRR